VCARGITEVTEPSAFAKLVRASWVDV